MRTHGDDRLAHPIDPEVSHQSGQLPGDRVGAAGRLVAPHVVGRQTAVVLDWGCVGSAGTPHPAPPFLVTAPVLVAMSQKIEEKNLILTAP